MHRVFMCYVSVPLYTKIYFELEVGQDFLKKKKKKRFWISLQAVEGIF